MHAPAATRNREQVPCTNPQPAKSLVFSGEMQNWDDLRFVLALAKAGSLAKAGKELGVDHTTVGRRVEALEESLQVKLFTRTTGGYILTLEAEGLLPDIRRVEDAVLALSRNAHTQDDSLVGTVRVTSAETFGAAYLAPLLANFGKRNPGLTVELHTGKDILDLARREADIAVRMFRSRHEDLVVKRAGELAHGLYATKSYLDKQPLKNAKQLCEHPLLTGESGPGIVETHWFAELASQAKPVFVSNLTLALLEAARAGAGIAVLPRYMGDRDKQLVHLPMPSEPRETIWITVHRDLRQARRVRVVLDYLNDCLTRDKTLLLGA
jgi:DNA-binding transcriptional LysR family regulator